MQFTIGGHVDRNGTISQLSGVYTEFRNIRDEELGTTDYRRSVHILRDRDEENWIERSEQEIVNGEYPIRAVTKAEFEGDWPFRADRVIVERRGKIFYIVNIEGFAFALNGAARSRFNIPDPHDAGVAVLGKSISSFIGPEPDRGGLPAHGPLRAAAPADGAVGSIPRRSPDFRLCYFGQACSR